MKNVSRSRSRARVNPVLPLIALCTWPLAQSDAQTTDPQYLVDPSISCYSETSDINDSGEAVGRYSPSGTCYDWTPFYWTEAGGLEEIEVEHCDASWAVKINSSGQVLGLCRFSNPFPPQDIPFLWSKATGLTILWLDDGIICGSDDSVIPVDINDNGDIIGNCISRSTPYYRYPFYLSSTGSATILDLSPAYATAMDLNNIGDVLIQTYNSGDGGALVWNAAGASTRDLEHSNQFVRVYELNDLGQAVGYDDYDAAVWDADGVKTNIHPAGNPYRSAARSINNAGQVVGYIRTNTNYFTQHEAFIWTEQDGLQAVGDAGTDDASACGVQPVYVGPINDDGQFIGTRRTNFGFDCEGPYAHTAYYGTETGGMVDLMATTLAVRGVTRALSNTGKVAGSYDEKAVLWTIPSGPQTPVEEVEIVKDLIDDLVASGSLNDGQGTSLNTKLDASAGKLTDGKLTPGCNILEAFINEIEAKINSGELSQAEGDAVIAAARDVSSCAP